MVPGGSPLYWLDRIRRDYPMALHGVSMSSGSIDPLDMTYLGEFKALIERVQPWRGVRAARSGLGQQDRNCASHWPSRPGLLDRAADMTVILRSTLTCPSCGAARTETMSTDACQYFYECPGCMTLLKPKPGDCCVFCSYGTMPCSPIQQGQADDCCRPGGA